MNTKEIAKKALRGSLWSPSKEIKEALIKSVDYNLRLAILETKEQCARLIESCIIKKSSTFFNIMNPSIVIEREGINHLLQDLADHIRKENLEDFLKQ